MEQLQQGIMIDGERIVAEGALRYHPVDKAVLLSNKLSHTWHVANARTIKMVNVENAIDPDVINLCKSLSAEERKKIIRAWNAEERDPRLMLWHDGEGQFYKNKQVAEALPGPLYDEILRLAGVFTTVSKREKVGAFFIDDFDASEKTAPFHFDNSSSATSSSTRNKVRWGLSFTGSMVEWVVVPQVGISEEQYKKFENIHPDQIDEELRDKAGQACAFNAVGQGQIGAWRFKRSYDEDLDANLFHRRPVAYEDRFCMIFD